MNPETKKWLLIGGVVVLVLYFVLKGRGQGASTGTITQLGPTASEASIQEAQLSAASNAFDTLIGAQASEQATAAGLNLGNTQATDSLEALETEVAGQTQVAGITSSAYTQALTAQTAMEEAIAQTETAPALTQVQTQQTTGIIGSILGGLGGLGALFGLSQPLVGSGGSTSTFLPYTGAGVPSGYVDSAIPSLPGYGAGYAIV
jgi:hypothetical protein